MTTKQPSKTKTWVVERRRADPATIRVALAGARGSSESCLQSIRDTDGLELVAVGESDPETCRALRETLTVPTYEDYRSLLVESARSGLDLVVVALEPFESRELVRQAGASGVTVFHPPPFARTTREARELLDAFPEDGAQLWAPRFWHFEPAFAELDRIIEEIGPIYTVSATVTTTDTVDGWRGDSVRSGGGVLLNGAYPYLDLIVATFGCPESAFARTGFIRTGGGPRTYDTEDGVVLSLRFGQGCVASLSAVRAAAQSSWRVVLHGTQGTIEVSNQGWCKDFAANGEQTRGVREVDDYHDAGLRTFVAAHHGQARRQPTPGEDHVTTLATIDAAYLSIRTGAPESPRQFLY